MNIKFGIILMFLAVLAMPLVTAQPYSIEMVEVNGVLASTTGTTSVPVERGDTMTVEVWYLATALVDDVRIRAEIEGYEYGDIRDQTEMFDLKEGDYDRKVLRLEIPEDLDTDKTYTLRVKISDSGDSVENQYNIRIAGKRHAVVVQDVLFTPSSLEVAAGKMLFATVRLENLGDRKEEDIKVTMKIPKLGLSASTYIDELTNKEDADSDEETSASTDEMFLRIPENADGEYDLIVEVEYNRGHTVEKESYKLYVKGKTLTPTEAAKLTVSVDSITQKVARGAGAVYQISFSNLGGEARTFNLDVNGEGTWARSRVDPQTLTVRPDSTGEMFVFISASEDALLGTHVFTVSVMSEGKLVQEINLRADVSDKAVTSDLGGLRRGLEIGFIVLLIILVILGIVLAARKMGKGDEGIEESEGKSYY